MTAPMPKTHEIISRLVALQGNESRDELELRRLRQEAKRLLVHDPGDAHMALGMIACLEDREQEAIRDHEAALRCGWSTERALNYAVTLRHFYRHDDASRQALEVAQKDPLNLEGIKVALRAAYAAGRFRLAAQWLIEYGKRVPNGISSDLADIRTRVLAVLPMVDRLALTDDLIAAMQRLAWALVRTLGGGKEIGIIDQVGDDGQGFLCRTLQLPITFDAAQALNDRFVEQLAEQEEWPLENIIIALREKEAA